MADAYVSPYSSVDGVSDRREAAVGVLQHPRLTSSASVKLGPGRNVWKRSWLSDGRRDSFIRDAARRSGA